MLEGYTTVVTVETTEGDKPAVLAAHSVIGASLSILLAVIDKAIDDTAESEASEVLDEIFTAYEQFVTSPGRIVAAMEQSSLGESPEQGSEYE